EAGLDCSGMVSYIYDKAAGVRLEGSAAQMAQQGRPVASRDLEPGDLVFFNTRNRPRSHVGIYVGEGKFVHAPQSNGKVKVSSLRSSYFAARFEEARRYL
ncbi:MAG TPA: C40 family peptidase, partial [Burkholderiales bacterium]